MPSIEKKQALVIRDWHNGIAESEHLGFADMRNVDIYTTPGALKANFRTDKVSASVVTDLVKWFVINPVNGDIYGLGDTGKVWRSTDDGTTWAQITGNTTTNASGDGLAIWKDYLFVARNTILDVYGPLSGAAAWTNSWQTNLTAAGGFHPMLIGQDDILYIGNQRYIASVKELTTFVPATASSYTYTVQALDLPANYKVKCLAEIGKWLLVGTWMGSSVFEIRIADIFPWDRVSSSFDFPVRLDEYGVHQMIVKDNLLWIHAGVLGNIYVSNLSSAKLIRSLPFSVTNMDTTIFLSNYPGAIMKHKNRVHFGIASGTTNSSLDGYGVWSVTDAGNIVFENQISTDTTSPANALQIGALLPTGAQTYLIGWRDNTTYGIDQVSNSQRYPTYKAYVTSAIYHIGTPYNKRTFEEITFELDRPLIAAQGVRLKYRTDLAASFTTIGTFDFATYGAIRSFTTGPGIVDAEFVQIRAEIAETGNAPIALREIRLV